jgi:hypothetical protein
MGTESWFMLGLNEQKMRGGQNFEQRTWMGIKLQVKGNNCELLL